jgi:anti-sigma regulatory factor (Ser/Thr protein kinase)
MSEDVMSPALLVVSELVTNAVEHARPPVTLQLARPEEDILHIEVTDSGPASHEGPWTASCSDDEHGRGRAIVAALATAHGCHTTAGDHASTHWAVLSTSD